MLIKTEKILVNQLNPNVMPDDVRLKLKNNIIEQGGKYPPLILRDLKNGTYRLIDGHNRLIVLKELGNKEVNCEVWDVDDKTEYLLLATLNELKGTQDLTKRAVLLDTLTNLGVDRMKILKLIPEDSRRLDFVLSIVKARESGDINDTIEAERDAMRERFISEGIDPNRAAAMADIYAFKKYVPKTEDIEAGSKFGLRKVLIFWFDTDEDFNFACKFFNGENEKEPNTQKLLELIK